MGFEDEVEQSFSRPRRRTNGGSKQTYDLTLSVVPRGTSFYARWSSSFLLLGLILHGFHAAASSRVHRNSVPSNPDERHFSAEPDKRLPRGGVVDVT